MAFGSVNPSEIETCYDSESPTKITYNLRLESSKLTSPQATKEYFSGLLENLSKKVSEEALDEITLRLEQLDKKHANLLQNIAREKIDDLKDSNEYIVDASHAVLNGSVIAGGVAGLYFLYGTGADYATQAAEYMADKSHYLAPLAGLAQIGISALPGTIGVLAGVFASKLLNLPIQDSSRRVRTEMKSYSKINSALTKIVSESENQVEK